MKTLCGSNVDGTSFCDAIAINHDKMVLKFFINTIAKPYEKRFIMAQMKTKLLKFLIMFGIQGLVCLKLMKSKRKNI